MTRRAEAVCQNKRLKMEGGCLSGHPLFLLHKKWSIWDSNPIGILKTVYFESLYVYEILKVTMK